MSGILLPPNGSQDTETPLSDCSGLAFLTVLNSPDPNVLSRLRSGDTLKLRLVGSPPVVEVLTKDEMIAGSITGSKLPPLISCIRKINFEALVVGVRGGSCEILVRPA